MRLFLVVEKPERLEEQGAEFQILHGSVMREQGLTAWAPRNLGVEASTAFLEIATKAREKGFALYALPGKASVETSGGVVTEEVPVADRKILVKHQPDWAGNCLVRFEMDDGGVNELEAPGWLVADLLNTRAELKNTRDALRVKSEHLDRMTVALADAQKENVTLKAGQPLPGPKGRARKKTGENGPASPATASVDGPPTPGTPTVADAKAELAATLASDASKAPEKPKYRGSGGNPD